MKGPGNQVDYGARIYDTRLGKFLSEDPFAKKFPMLSTYQYASNNPIWNIDIDGLEGGPANQTGLTYIIQIMDGDGIIKNVPVGSRFKYHTNKSTLPHQDIFKVSGTVTSGVITMDQAGPACPTVVRTVTYRDVSPKGATEPHLVLWKFDETLVNTQQQTNAAVVNTTISVPAQFNPALYNPGTGRMGGQAPGTNPIQLTANGQTTLNAAVAGLVPTTNTSPPIVGTNAAGLTTTTITTNTNSVITVNVSSGTFGGNTPAAAVNNLLRGRMATIINGLGRSGIPAGNIIPGTMTPNSAPAVNLNVLTTTTTTTTTSFPVGASYPPPPTDINKTWQR